MPLQCDTGWYVDPEHEAAAPQTTEAAPCWQPPLPLQAPVLPHGGAAAHWPDGAVTPAPMLAHVPRLPARLHARHVPQLAALQHTPSTQLPPAQSPPSLHVAPSPCLATQLLPLQKLPLAQSSSPLQLVRHADAPQTYGLQLSVAAGAQTPAPLHCDTG